MKWLDIPPIWLLAFLCAAWWQPRLYDAGLSLGDGVANLLGGLLVGAGLLCMAFALMEFRRHRTTPVPHLDASALITSGIFGRSRNPIYLGDAMVLAGLCLYWDAVLALVLVPVFVWVIERRFIIPEENRLRRAFRTEYARYEQKVRRWL